MTKEISHDEIAQRLIQAKVVDFAAMGKLVTELGPVLAVSDRGWHGFLFGRFNMLACAMPAGDAARLVGALHGGVLTSAALEGAAQGSVPR